MSLGMFKTKTIVTEEARKDSAIPMNEVVIQAALRKLAREDLTQAGEPTVTWTEFKSNDVMYDRYRAGDWLATVRIPVEEIAEDMEVR